MCIHISILPQCLINTFSGSGKTCTPTDFKISDNLESETVASVSNAENSRELTKRLSTLRLAEKTR